MSDTGNNLLLSFYGDDFTGSADAMEALSLSGIRTALFLQPPARKRLPPRFAGLQALGVAGVSRSMTPGQMDHALPSIFEEMKALGAPLFHYKICSTFDSSPTVGSIGRAIDLGWRAFPGRFVPLVVGAPALNRYCLFGNLFATVGAETFRLDRHPTMRQHPGTPMEESDLRVHLSHQTNKRVALFDIRQLDGTSSQVDERLARLIETNPEIVLFDVLDELRLAQVGRMIWRESVRAAASNPLFVVGSSGVEYALTAHWHETEMLPTEPEALPAPGSADQLLVVSGSCSPVTAQQIEWARARGFAGLELDAGKLVDPECGESECATVVRQALEVLDAPGRSLILYTALGPEDARIETTTRRLSARGFDVSMVRERLGEQLGRILRALLEATALRRVVIAGGDTSGHAARQLGIYALELLAPIAPGSPLCRASSHHAKLDGLEIALKGGQGGHRDYFEAVRRGSA